MQFPYSTDKRTARYVVSKKQFYYTGLYYSADDLKTITSVERNSPAYKAGIRPGAVITKINGEKFIYSKSEITNGYKRFFNDTMGFRDPQTLFVDAKGFPDCMYWKRSEYDKVKEAFGKSIYTPVFKYLYNFEEYISGKAVTKLSIETKSKKYDVTPEKRNMISIRAF
jgi:membrane-associated protease RseP (regulator of RpoE activity)